MRQKKEEEKKLQEEARKANEKEVYHEEPSHGNIEAPPDGLSESPKQVVVYVVAKSL